MVLAQRRQHAPDHHGELSCAEACSRCSQLTRGLLQYIWICLRLFQAVDAHSGYDFPWSLSHIFPAWAGAE